LNIQENKFCFQARRVMTMGVAMCLFALPSWADEGKAPDTTASSAPARQNVPNSITQTAFGKGVLKCSARIQQITSFANTGAEVNATMTFFPSDADNGLLSVIQAIDTPLGPVSVSSTYAPNQATGCQAAYDAVTYHSKSCQAVASDTYKDLKEANQPQKSIKILEGGPYLKVLLFSAGTGCVSIKKEVIYR
jgi:hypothetical protein